METNPPFELDLSQLRTPAFRDTRSDHQRALDMCAALSGNTNGMVFLIIPGDPYSKSRPRFTREGKTYTQRADQDAEQRTGWYLRRAFRRPLTGNVALGAVFFRPNRQRIDADNMLKHICDAANGIVYADDSQVTGIMGVVELSAEAPRTVLMIAHHTTTMTRGSDATIPCPVCNAPMSLVGRTTPREFCSRACRNKANGLDLTDPVQCTYCKEPFKRTTRAQTLCSPQCRADSFRDKRKAKALPKSRCQDCGKQLAHRRGGRCRDCWKANPAQGAVTT